MADGPVAGWSTNSCGCVWQDDPDNGILGAGHWVLVQHYCPVGLDYLTAGNTDGLVAHMREGA